MNSKLTSILISLLAFASAGYAQLAIPYADGSDGVLNITSNTVIDLSQAVTGTWTNTSTAPGNGIYDPIQWAVVFKYSSVNIASNAVVTFLNHPTHAPVVWLVSSNATINGEVNLDGQPSIQGLNTGAVEPGPGGFRGGSSSSILGPSGGFGPGGGYYPSGNGNGSYAGSYGSTNVLPLVGGSGSAGFPNSYNPFNLNLSGSGGGGAILIAASGSITINGYCHALGGLQGSHGYQGSGGALRLVANKILGTGTLATFNNTIGGTGRIRLEANSVANALAINPQTAAVLPGNPPAIFPPANGPIVTVMSVAGLAVPSDPRAIMSANAGADDLTIATTNAVSILLQTSNFPTNGTVNVYIEPGYGAQSVHMASFVSGDSNQATWQVSTVLNASPGHTIIQARAVAP